MYKNIIDKIKSCLPANRDEYVIHEPFFDNKSYNDSKKCLKSSFVSTQGHYLEKFELKLKDPLISSLTVIVSFSETTILIT